MQCIFQPLKTFSRKKFQPTFKFKFPTHPIKDDPNRPISLTALSYFVPIWNFQGKKNPNPNSVNHTKQFEFNIRGRTEASRLVHSVADSEKPTKFRQDPYDHSAVKVQSLLKTERNNSIEEIERALNQCELFLTEDLVLNVLRRHYSDWKPAYLFFNWVCRQGEGSEYTPGSSVYNEILDILGRMRRFEELNQVFHEMSKRKGLVNENTFGIVVNRYAAAHKVEAAIDFYHKRREFGYEPDLIAFQTLLMSLCRHKHVEAAEFLFHSKENEFCLDIKSMNIILNGWCVLGNLCEAKRFWKDIITYKCKPDRFTYGTFINSLTKAGKLGTAVKLFWAMWDKGCTPDVAICNCIIDALCFKKRIPQALEIFGEMSERGCPPNVATYNSLIKHLCKIRRMEKVYELLEEMEQKKGSCLPNSITFTYLLKSTKKPEEVSEVLERMGQNGCEMSDDTYNLTLRLYMEWGYEEKVRFTWVDMERNGFGPDRRSYTIMIHGLYDKGRMEDALCYFSEMTSKGMVPEPRTLLLVNAMNIKLKEKEGEQGLTLSSDKTSWTSRRVEKKKS